MTFPNKKWKKMGGLIAPQILNILSLKYNWKYTTQINTR